MNNRQSLDHVQNAFMWGLLGLVGWLLVMLLVLWLSSFADYGYRAWYQALGIDQHIQHYAPANHHKPGFERLSAAEHRALFGQIVDAVHDRGGQTLADISYWAEGRRLALLTPDEINHLLDVKRLIRLLEGIFIGLLLLAALVYGSYCRRHPVALRQFMAANGLVLSGLLIALWLMGPKAVFYWLHEQIFPPQHPWFFYWEESLMSTLMKAPYLFGGIAGQTLLLALPLWLLAIYALLRQSSRHS